MRAILLLCLLAVAAGLVTAGVAQLSVAWAFIVAGVELAGLAVLTLVDAK